MLLFALNFPAVGFEIFASIKLTHLFLMHPFSTPWKYQKTVIINRQFSDILYKFRYDNIRYQPFHVHIKKLARI